MKNSLAGLDWVNIPFSKIYLPLFFGSDKNFFQASDILELQGGRVWCLGWDSGMEGIGPAPENE